MTSPPCRQPSPPRGPSTARGVVLLEALVSIVLLSVGVLGVIALQATMTGALSDAKYRTEAGFLAEQIIGQAWSNAGDIDTYKYNDSAAGCDSFARSSNAALAGWLGSDGKAGTVYGLPDGRAKIAIGDKNTVSVTLCWKAPKEDDWHLYQTTTQIRLNKS